MKNHCIRKLLALAIAILVVCSLSCAAFADYTAATAPTNISLVKYLKLDSTVKVPAVTFSFEVTPGTAVNATATTPRIEAGTGTPTIADITFAVTDTVYDAVQSGDTVGTLATGEGYAKRSMNVNFNTITFPAPGVYRYVVTESLSGTEQAKQGITNDANPTRFMDVYVTNVADTGDELAVTSVVFHNEPNGIPTADLSAATKNKGFVNSFASQSLTLSKSVTGNQGNRYEYFEFTVAITNAIPGSVFPVDLANATANVATGKTNVSSLTASDAGAVTATFYLRSSQSIVIKGLTDDVAYTITEADPAALGYTVSTVGTNATDTNTADNIFAVASVGSDDDTVAFTNHRQGVVPTGIIMDVAPYVLLVLLAGGAILLINRKKSCSKG